MDSIFFNFERILCWYEIKAYFFKNLFLFLLRWKKVCTTKNVQLRAKRLEKTWRNRSGKSGKVGGEIIFEKKWQPWCSIFVLRKIRTQITCNFDFGFWNYLAPLISMVGNRVIIVKHYFYVFPMEPLCEELLMASYKKHRNSALRLSLDDNRWTIINSL